MYTLWLLFLTVVPLETREVLRIAACLGDGYFSLFLLSRVMNISRLDICCYIKPAQELGLISTFQSLVESRSIYIDRQAFSYEAEDYPWSNESFTPGEEEPFGDQWLWENHKAREIDIGYEFIHNKIQEACYEMIPQDQLPVTHLTIGRSLKDYSIQNDQVLFEVCNHIGEAHALLQDSERREMAKLNLNAARKAITRAAFEHALQYSLSARTLLKNIPDGINNMFTLGVSQCLLQSLYNLARYEEALREAETILQSSSDDLEVLVIGTEKIRVLQSLGRNQEAYTYGMEMIRFSGFRVPDDIWNGPQITAMTEWYKSGIDTEKTTRVCLS
jgi:predicted ATPase